MDKKCTHKRNTKYIPLAGLMSLATLIPLYVSRGTNPEPGTKPSQYPIVMRSLEPINVPLNSFNYEAPLPSSLPLKGPVYSENKEKGVPANYCARYVRVAAKELFNRDYPYGDAWDFREKPSVKTIPIKNKTLEQLANEGSLVPGDAVGMYYPRSEHNDDKGAKKAGYTHMALYLGKEGNILFFADKFGSKTRPRISLEAMEKTGLRPVEVITSKKK